MSTRKASDDEQPLHCAISGLLNSGLYSDATIICGDQTFHVHKAVICTQSAYFAHAFDKNNGFKEACTNVIELQGVSSSTVRSMLEFMYHGDYSKCDGPNEELMATIYVYTAAEMFQMNALKKLAAQRFEVGANNMFSLPTLGLAIETIYRGTVEQDRGLRDVVIETAIRKMDELIKIPAFNDVLEDVSTFSKDLVHALYSRQKQKSIASSKVMIRCSEGDCQNEMSVGLEALKEDHFFLCNTCTPNEYWE